MMEVIRRLPPGIIYMHNGGRFDIFFMLDYISASKPMLIIKNRITQAFIECDGGHHKLRDSYKILPFPLAEYDKDEIDYTWFERDVRNKHKSQIVKYLKKDCSGLWTLCVRFLERFGNKITIGAAARKELKSFHEIGESFNEDADFIVRGIKYEPDERGEKTKIVRREYSYFFGARVERYKVGVFKGNIKVFDVNSMYPHVMRSFEHPIGWPVVGTQITDNTFFISARGHNRGAFPTRTKAGIKFDVPYGVFSVSIHEWIAAQEMGLFDCDEILETLDFAEHTNFAAFVDHYYKSRKIAKEDGDKISALFFKFLLNNSYGRFAINPANYTDNKITGDDTDLRLAGWKPEVIMMDLGKTIWSKPSDNTTFSNVATGASITGAARSVLMRAIPNAVNPLYVDTDCIICEDLQNVPIHGSELGAWDCEKVGNKIAIAGRKMYAIWQGSKCIKMACKGVELSPSEIARVARGKMVEYMRDAPTFALDGSARFLTREVRAI
jgi:hypothetical protein